MQIERAYPTTNVPTKWAGCTLTTIHCHLIEEVSERERITEARVPLAFGYFTSG